MSITKAIVLVTEKSQFMHSKKPKSMHKILDRTMIEYVIEGVIEAGVSEVCVVVDQGQEQIKNILPSTVTCVVQQDTEKKCALTALEDFIQSGEQFFLLKDNIPLMTRESLCQLQETHEKERYDITFLTSMNSGLNNELCMVRAEVLATEYPTLFSCLVSSKYHKGIEDVAVSIGRVSCKDALDTFEVESKQQLFEATAIMRQRIQARHMECGVTIIDPYHVYIGKDVVIESDAVIHPGAIIEGKSIIKSEASIGPNSHIVDSIIEAHVSITQSTVLESHIEEDTTVGPYAYIRPNSHIGRQVKIGDFVEIKNATIDEGTKISHLTYVGDADVGKGVNFGCGTVTVNYDGTRKHRTVIKDHAFIGCNTNLVAPVTIEEKSYTAAGSTITSTVPKDSLGIARSRQENKINWVKKQRK